MTGLWKVGVDIGGTFTDIVATDGQGNWRDAKTPTVSRDPLQGLRQGLAALKLTFENVDGLVHGATLVTNALVEAKLARVALITTAGFEDVLAIARASRDQLYRMEMPPRAPPVAPRALTMGFEERVGPDGAVQKAPTDVEIARVVDWVKASGAEAVAICLLHAYANPAHERALAEALRPHCRFLSVSHEVSPEAREYERTLATVLNAAVMPLAGAYLDRLMAEVPASANLQLFHSAGGMAGPAVLRSLPLALALSGPAAGAAATAEICRRLGIEQGLAFDMGGTTTDVCLVTKGVAEISLSRSLGGRQVRQPMVAIESVGAGGGSLIRLGPGGLTVGPESAGADPGPAAYGRGGKEPTVTDVNVILGYLEPARTLGDSIRIDPDAAEAALRPIAEKLGRDLTAAALGVMEVANAVMARALRRVTVHRGADLRQATLIAYGGAGPMHAVSLARHVGIARVVVPAFSGGFSALGCVTAPELIARQQTLRLSSARWDQGKLDHARAGLIEAATAALNRPGAAVALRETALIRYVGQSVAVETAFEAGLSVEDLGARFREAHHRLYGYATEEPFLLESLRVEASIAADAPVWPARPSGGEAKPTRISRCCFGPEGFLDTPRYDRSALGAGIRVQGPAILEDDWSTVLLPPGAVCVVGETGHLDIEVGA